MHMYVIALPNKLSLYGRYVLKSDMESSFPVDVSIRNPDPCYTEALPRIVSAHSYFALAIVKKGL